MKFLAINEQGNSPVKYLALEQEALDNVLSALNDEDLDPNFIEVTDEELIAELLDAVSTYIKSDNGITVDKYGNIFMIQPSPVPWAKWLVTMD